MPIRLDITGRRFGRYEALWVDTQNKRRITRWICRCDCGVEKLVQLNALTTGNVISCGCFNRENQATLHTKHGKKGTRTYGIWMGMRKRCNGVNQKSFVKYGARGIKVCERWQDFALFLIDMGECPGVDHSIDRYPDNDGNYEPGNCRWATRTEQGRNKSNNVLVSDNGVTRTLPEYAEMHGLGYWAAISRVRRGLLGRVSAQALIKADRK